ncbi:MAG TPA: class I SAM-dependent methyltransferase [Isosphaeraceae bacterium]|nr:class I SAM-dependent methyltransferase [Isosphaeraceae bacterium]
MIEVWSSGNPDDSMNEAILADLSRQVRRHPWWKARAALTQSLLKRLGVRPPSRVLEAGCGWGSTLSRLERLGYHVTGLDLSRRALDPLHAERSDRRLIQADLAQDLPPSANESFETVLALDVIEHLDDDRAAVTRLARLVQPGGWLILSVPALPELFSEFDSIQGHRRRYLPASLRAVFDGSGLSDPSLFWWGSWMVPILSRRRTRSLGRPGEPPHVVYQRHLRLPAWPGPLILRTLMTLEAPFALSGRLRTGTSLFALAQKPDLNTRPGRVV